MKTDSPWTNEAFLRSVHIVPDLEPEEKPFGYWNTPVLIGMVGISCALWILIAFLFIWAWAAL